MNPNILKYLKAYSYKELNINRLLVSSFLKFNEIKNIQNRFISEFIMETEDEIIQIDEFLSLFSSNFDIELLLELFEFVISPEDKEINGAVFTPKYIREYIVKQIFKEYDNNNTDIDLLRFADIACGCGGFFCSIAEVYRVKLEKSYFQIYQENIFGLDIQNYSIIRSKIILVLYAIINGEDRDEFYFNLFEGNALDFDWNQVDVINTNQGFDAIVGNPPYVGSSNLDIQTKKLIKTWSVSSTGKLDLYIPFFEIGIKWLRNSGILGFITVNNFYRSLNGRALRAFFSEKHYSFKLIDFGNEQVFKSRLTYTCICLIQKSKGNLLYTNTTPLHIENLSNKDFISFEYQSLDNIDGWQLEDAKTQLNLFRLENSGEKLGDLFSIRNGFATLRNKIFLFRPINEDAYFYYFEKDKEVFQVEKEICRDAIKPNVLKSELDLEILREKIIFPYTFLVNDDNDLFQKLKKQSIQVIKEDKFKSNYPYAYTYLSKYRLELSKRDKGQRVYETWYAYGRSQALNINGLKLLFPYISDVPYFVFTDDKNLLFYNGYAIVSESELELKFIQKILLTDIFWYYIIHTSKPYAGNYFALAKNYVKNFSIPAFTEEEKQTILRSSNKKTIRNILIKKYNLVDFNFSID